MTFEENAKLGMEHLAKQEPVTLEQVRAQTLWLKIVGSSTNKKDVVKHHLRMYNPEWTQEQIEDEAIRLFNLHGQKYSYSWEERARISMELLAKQLPFTLEQKREQFLRVEIRGSSRNKEAKVKYNLKIYHPDWTEEQIDAEVIRLFELYK